MNLIFSVFFEPFFDFWTAFHHTLWDSTNESPQREGSTESGCLLLSVAWIGPDTPAVWIWSFQFVMGAKVLQYAL